MDGVSDALFAPDGTVTRGMIVTILYRLEGGPGSNCAMPFDDVEDGACTRRPSAGRPARA